MSFQDVTKISDYLINKHKDEYKDEYERRQSLQGEEAAQISDYIINRYSKLYRSEYNRRQVQVLKFQDITKISDYLINKHKDDDEGFQREYQRRQAQKGKWNLHNSYIQDTQYSIEVDDLLQEYKDKYNKRFNRLIENQSDKIEIQ